MSIQCCWKSKGIRCVALSHDNICPVCKIIESSLISHYFLSITNVIRIMDSGADNIVLQKVIDKITTILELRKKILSLYHEIDPRDKYPLQQLFETLCILITNLYEKWNKTNYQHTDKSCTSIQIDKLQNFMKIMSTDTSVKCTEGNKQDMLIIQIGSNILPYMIERMNVQDWEFRYLYDYIRKLKLYINNIFDNITRITGGGEDRMIVKTSRRDAPYNPITLLEINEFISSFPDENTLRSWCREVSDFFLLVDEYYIVSYITVINNKHTVIIRNQLIDRNIYLKAKLSVTWLGSKYVYNIVE